MEERLMMRLEKKKSPLSEKKCITKSKIHFELSKQRMEKKMLKCLN